jgi:hypothetical protein
VALDFAYALRTLSHSPGFAAVAVVSLALGIGASTALYGAVRIALLDTLPVQRPQELRLLHWSGPPDLDVSQYNSGAFVDSTTRLNYRTNLSFPTFRSLLQYDPERVVGFNFPTRLTVGYSDAQATASSGLLLSGNAFEVLGIPIERGRGLSPEDDRPESPPVAIVTHAFWRNVLGGDRDAVGRVIRINQMPFSIVGVTAPAFRGLSTGGRVTPHVEVVVPISTQPLLWVADGGPSLQATHVLWVRVMTRVAEPSDTIRAGLSEVLSRSLIETGVVPETRAGEVHVLLRPGARGVDPISANAERPLLAHSSRVRFCS